MLNNYRQVCYWAIVGLMMVGFTVTGVRADRGRPIIDPVNKTLVADNGYLLRGCHSHFHSFAYEGSYKNLSWWIALRDNANLNVVRMMAFLGSWPKSPEVVNEATLAARLDVAVNMAAAAGMYIIIDNHSNCCGFFNWDTFHAFWDVVAPRYKDRTHVIYEAQNEPYYKNATGAGIKAQYDYIRAKAPNTHIILHSIAKIDDIEVKAAKESGIDYNNANASIGFHSYQSPDTLVV